MIYPKGLTDDQQIALCVYFTATAPAWCKPQYHRLYRPNSRGWYSLTAQGRHVLATVSLEQEDDFKRQNNLAEYFTPVRQNRHERTGEKKMKTCPKCGSKNFGQGSGQPVTAEGWYGDSRYEWRKRAGVDTTVLAAERCADCGFIEWADLSDTEPQQR